MIRLVILLLITLSANLSFAQDYKWPKADTVVYGTSCGYTGSAPKYRLLLNSYLLEKDTDKLNIWLYADNPTLNAYAIEGYCRLKGDGFQLSEPIRKRIAVLKTKKDLVNMFEGCSYYRKSLKQAVHQYNFD